MRVAIVILFAYVIVLDILWFAPLGNESLLEWAMLTVVRLTWGVTRFYGLTGYTDLLSWLDIFAQPLCVSLYCFVYRQTDRLDIVSFDNVLRLFLQRQWVDNYEQFIIACNLASIVPYSQYRKFNCLPSRVGPCLSHALTARYKYSNSRQVFYLCGIWINIIVIGTIRIGTTGILMSFLLVALFWPHLSIGRLVRSSKNDSRLLPKRDQQPNYTRSRRHLQVLCNSQRRMPGLTRQQQRRSCVGHHEHQPTLVALLQVTSLPSRYCEQSLSSDNSRIL